METKKYVRTYVRKYVKLKMVYINYQVEYTKNYRILNTFTIR